MRLSYDPETDSLYIELTERPSADTEELAEGLRVDYDEADNIIGIEVDHASQVLDLTTLDVSSLPATRQDES
jgi:uncharacterized protein YuzE